MIRTNSVITVRTAMALATGIGVLAGSFLGDSAKPVSAAQTQTVLVTNTAGSQNVPVAVQNLPAVQNVAGSVAVSNFPSVQTVAGSVAVISGDTTSVLWEGLICGSAAGGSDVVDISGFRDVSVTLVGIELGGADAVFVQTSVGGYFGDLAELTVPNGATTMWHATAPGTTLSLFCNLSQKPSRLSAAIYGRP